MGVAGDAAGSEDHGRQLAFVPQNAAIAGGRPAGNTRIDAAHPLHGRAQREHYCRLGVRLHRWRERRRLQHRVERWIETCQLVQFRLQLGQDAVPGFRRQYPPIQY
jgi:hypothetical protein